MGKNLMIITYVLIMIATVVIMDILFFRHRFWERLIANLGVVLIYVAFYSAFLKKH